MSKIGSSGGPTFRDQGHPILVMRFQIWLSTQHAAEFAGAVLEENI